MSQAPTEHLKAQRVLFFVLWGLILLAGAIWRFWPDLEMKREKATPEIHISQELNSWFDRAAVTEDMPSRYTIELAVNSKYRESLEGEEKQVSLRFHLRGEHRVLSEGTATCRLAPDSAVAQVTLENPRRVQARAIDLYLER